MPETYSVLQLGESVLQRPPRKPTNREVFEAYVEHALAPTLESSGRVVIMDNLSAHKPARVRELIEQQGCELIYLPAYSPDFNPIEEAFSKLKVWCEG